MTVIAWDGQTLAADKRSTMGSLIRSCTKIFKHNGELLGYAGSAAFGEHMLDWYKNGADPKDFPIGQRDKDDCVDLLVIKADGSIQQFQRTPFPIAYTDHTFAIGSGRDFALAAMALGCNATAAVELTCTLDCACGNGVDTLTLN